MVSVDRKGVSIPDERGAAVVCGGEEKEGDTSPFREPCESMFEDTGCEPMVTVDTQRTPAPARLRRQVLLQH